MGLYFIAVCVIAAIFCMYAVITDGWDDAKSTVFWTIGIFGGVALVWIAGDKISKK